MCMAWVRCRPSARGLALHITTCSNGYLLVLVLGLSLDPQPVAFNTLLCWRQEAGLSGVVLNVTLQSPFVGPPGPSMVVPASWFAHRPLAAPPPPPPPPPPRQCELEINVTSAHLEHLKTSQVPS